MPTASNRAHCRQVEDGFEVTVLSEWALEFMNAARAAGYGYCKLGSELANAFVLLYCPVANVTAFEAFCLSWHPV
jgi:hypothetical protein